MKYDIYQNAPLVETVFKITFPGEPSVECNRDKFYEEIRSVYSRVLVPSLQGKNNAIPSQPYRFEREDSTNGVIMSINKFALYCKKYEGFKLFKRGVKNIFCFWRIVYN
ncbi:MAG: TIGR04255 family protein [Colwellia sp.]|nr:TIGR04255 family protein [Colwellia sp.]